MSVINEKIKAFNIGGRELYLIAKKVYKFNVNTMSAFLSNPGDTEEISPEAMELSKNESFKEAVAILAQPTVKLAFKTCGKLTKPERFVAYGAKTGKDNKFVSLHDNDGVLLMLLHESMDSFGSWYMDSFGSDAKEKTINFIKPEIPFETLLCIFNLLDLYKRKYMVDMLNFEQNPPEELYEDEFIALLERGAKSGDARWVMPALLVLVPGFENTTVEFLPEHLEYAHTMDFFTHSKNPENGRPVLLLGAPAQFMGMEFTHLWTMAVGLELSVLEGENVRVKSRHFFASTVETNHVVTLLPAEEGRFNARHEALSAGEMLEKVKEIIG